MSESPQENAAETEHRIRERAYHLWEADGRPEGRDEEYWERAKASVHDEERGEGKSSVVHGKVPQADVAAERATADRVGDQQKPTASQEKKDR